MRKPRIALAGLALALVAGCSLQPAYDRPEAPVAGTFPAGAAYKSAPRAPGGTTLPAGDIGWSDFMRDARLKRLVEIALPNNRHLPGAMLNVGQVRPQYRIQPA